jgi:hypothetical protein
VILYLLHHDCGAKCGAEIDINEQKEKNGTVIQAKLPFPSIPSLGHQNEAANHMMVCNLLVITEQG